MNQTIRELKRQFAGERLAPEQLKGLIRAGYVYRNGDGHLLTDKGRDALAQHGVYPGGVAHWPSDLPSNRPSTSPTRLFRWSETVTLQSNIVYLRVIGQFLIWSRQPSGRVSSFRETSQWIFRTRK
jgi:hypothetical protein